MGSGQLIIALEFFDERIYGIEIGMSTNGNVAGSSYAVIPT